MGELINRKDAINALVNKGQASKRYKLGEVWGLNSTEIRDALNELPAENAIPVKKLDKLIHHYELKLEHIRNDYDFREKWGHGAYDKHEMAMIEEFLDALWDARGTDKHGIPEQPTVPKMPVKREEERSCGGYIC
jgi:hypothetical protein